jgi:hypothetical protein
VVKKVLLVAALVGVPAFAAAQPPARRATNVEALIVYPSFYHLRSITVVGKVSTDQNGEVRLSDGTASVRVISKGPTPDGNDEVRGEFWDLGRMKADDPRLASYDLKATFHVDPAGTWPRSGEVTAIVATSVAPASAPLAPSIRAIVLSPSRYIGQRVTISGQYSARNLLGELPDAPGKFRYEFVLRSADAAIWILNMRPKGKNFELALDSRLDSGRWLEVSGTVQQGRGLQWIEADAGSLTLAKPPNETVPEEREQVRVTPAPPPEVVFSAPTDDETDVSTGTNIRIQFSRDLDPATLKGHILVAYVNGSGGGGGQPAASEFTTQYNAAARVLELKFTKPLERFRIVRVTLADGILGTDKQALKPWTLTFTSGG